MPKATKSQHIKASPSVSHTTLGCPSEAPETTASFCADTGAPQGISHPGVGVSPPSLPWSCHSCSPRAKIVACKWWCFFLLRHSQSAWEVPGGKSTQMGYSSGWECLPKTCLSPTVWANWDFLWTLSLSYVAKYPINLLGAWPGNPECFCKLHI